MAQTCVLADVACSGAGGVGGEHMAARARVQKLQKLHFPHTLKYNGAIICNVIITEVWNIFGMFSYLLLNCLIPVSALTNQAALGSVNRELVLF